jgi:hypothetical protein
MDLFTSLKSIKKEDGYYFLCNEEVKVYTEKSLQRESKSLNSIIDECSQKKKLLIWISPFHSDIYNNLSNNHKKQLIWIAPLLFTNFSSEEYSGIIFNNATLKYFLNEVKKNNSFIIKAHPTLFKYNFDLLLQKLIQQSASRIKTIDHFEKIWKNNFTKNKNKWLKIKDIKAIELIPPDLFILGGPSVDDSYKKIKKSQHIWAADTALPLLAHLNISPDLVFSIDAGFGSYEHFIQPIEKKILSNSIAVLDPLTFPLVYDITFKKIFTYAHLNPLIQATHHNFTYLTNNTNDVFGLMASVFHLMFDLKLPEVIGHDCGHINKATHFRGSAYHRRQFGKCNRFITPEKYFFQLSDRYNPH